MEVAQAQLRHAGIIELFEQVLDPLVERPDVVSADLAEVADRIIATDR